MHVTLRPQLASDLPLLTGGDSPFDEFGPHAVPTAPRPCALDAPGGLTIVADGEPAGDVSWVWVRWGPTEASRSARIGIWLRPEARGRGIGRLAQRGLAELFFAHTTTNRVEAHTDIENVAEQRSLEAAGFTREGVTRGAHWRVGRHHDAVLYAVLREDPAPTGRA